MSRLEQVPASKQMSNSKWQLIFATKLMFTPILFLRIAIFLWWIIFTVPLEFLSAHNKNHKAIEDEYCHLFAKGKKQKTRSICKNLHQKIAKFVTKAALQISYSWYTCYCVTIIYPSFASLQELYTPPTTTLLSVKTTL